MSFHRQHCETQSWSERSNLQRDIPQNNPQWHYDDTKPCTTHQHTSSMMSKVPQQQFPQIIDNQSQQLHPSMMGNLPQLPCPTMHNQLQPPMMENPSPVMHNQSRQQPPPTMGNLSQQQPPPMMSNPSQLLPPPMMRNQLQQHPPSMMGISMQQQPSPVINNQLQQHLPVMGNQLQQQQPPSILSNQSQQQLPPRMADNQSQQQPLPHMSNQFQQHSPSMIGKLLYQQPPPMMGSLSQQQISPTMSNPSRQQAPPPPIVGNPLQQNYPPVLGNPSQLQNSPVMATSSQLQSPIMKDSHQQCHSIVGLSFSETGNIPPQQPSLIIKHSSQLEAASGTRQPSIPGSSAQFQHHNIQPTVTTNPPQYPSLSNLPTPQPLQPDSVSHVESAIISEECLSSLQFPICNLLQNEVDQNWVDNWVKTFSSGSHCQRKHKSQKLLKISDVQLDVNYFQKLLSNLKNLQRESLNICENASQKEWEMIADQIINVKVELDLLKEKLDDSQYCSVVKKLVERRRKKRSRQRISKRKIVGKEQIIKENWKKEEEEIDHWRNLLIQEEENKQREKVVKEEADSILGEIRGKRQELQLMQLMLEDLVTLRQDRCKKGKTHGYIDTLKGKHHFTVMIDKLREMLNQQNTKYELEEQTLCVMMEESTCSARPQVLLRSISSTANQKQREITKCLFGDFQISDIATYSSFTAADCGLEMLIQRRLKWDKFAVNEDKPLATSVPPGWVMPPEQPNTSWKSFQVQDE